MSSLAYKVKELMSLEGQADGLAKDLQKVQETWSKGIQNVGALGLHEAENALITTLHAWDQEFTVYCSIMLQLGQKLQASARNNANADRSSAEAVRKLPGA